MDGQGVRATLPTGGRRQWRAAMLPNAAYGTRKAPRSAMCNPRIYRAFWNGQGGIRTRDGAINPILAYSTPRLSAIPPRREIAANRPLLVLPSRAVAAGWRPPLLPSLLPCGREGSRAGDRRS